MKKEIEVKFRVSDFLDVRQRLKKLGARLMWKGREENIYFDTPGHTLKKHKKVLRLRKWKGVENTITVKTGYPTVPRRYKERVEYQTSVADFNEMRLLLTTLGFIETVLYKKKREHWRRGAAHIELDTLADGRFFVEVEGGRKSIDRLAKHLNLNWKKSTTKSYVNLISKKNE
jgi:predicted adenylyl cyclase CyaB